MSQVVRRSTSFIARVAVGGSLVAGSFGLASLVGDGVAHAATTCGDSTQTVCPAISLSDVAPAPGGPEIVTGTGYADNETITMTFNSTPVSLGTATSDGNGSFTANVTVPSSAVVGDHTIVATDSDGNSATASLTVTASTVSTGTGATTGTGTTSSGTGSSLPVTGADTTKGLLIAGDLALLGVPLLLVARRRKA